MDKRLGIYVHVPYCISKCPYCGFYSKAVGDSFDVHGEEFKEYKSKLIKSIKEYGEVSMGKTVDSIFFGGGTPTVLRAHDLIGILGEIKDAYAVSPDCEITVEANPGTVNVDELKKLADWGFNRLSIGVQSFDKYRLKTLGRIHTTGEGEEAFLMAREAGFRNINLDLMFGIPGQSVSSWVGTLERALALKPEHISFYSLQLEEGTGVPELVVQGFRKSGVAPAVARVPVAVTLSLPRLDCRKLGAAGHGCSKGVRVEPEEVGLVTLSPTEAEVQGEVLPAECVTKVDGEQRIGRSDVLAVVSADLTVIVVILELEVSRPCLRLVSISSDRLDLLYLTGLGISPSVGFDLSLILEHAKFLNIVG